jgi:hypothetical protein
MNSEFVIGIDNGLKGAISIIDVSNNTQTVYPMPVRKNARDKNEYDLPKIIDILKPYKYKKVLFAQEMASPRFHEGSISSFTSGRGFGQVQGIAFAFNFNHILVSSQSWKKHFPELESKIISDMRIKIKELKLLNKTIKDIKVKNKNKKEIVKLNRLLKVQSKDEARFLATKLLPSLSEQFKLKKNDGNAEAVLIAIFAADCLDKNKV